MPNLRLHSLKLTNFKSYSNPGLTIDFMDGNNVIVGENGSGKSSILEGVKLALFGKLSEGRTLEQVIRSSTPQAVIELHFSVDGKEFISKRIISRKSPSKASLEDKLGHEMTNGTTNVTRDIETLLGIESHTFEDVVFAEQGDIAKITSDTLGDRRKALMKILGVERYLQSSESFRIIQRSLENRTIQLQKDIDIVNIDPVQLKEIEEKIVVLNNKVRESEKQKVIALKRLQEIHSLLSVVEELQNKVSLLEKEEVGHKKSIEALEAQKQEILSAVPLDYHNNLQKYISQINEELSVKRNELKELQQQISEIDKQLGILETIFVRLTKQRQQYQKVKTSLQNKLQALNIDQNDINNIFTKTQEEQTSLSVKMKNQSKEIANLEIKKGQITNLTDNLELKRQELKKIVNRHTKYQKELKTIFGTKIPTLEEIDKTIDDVDKLKTEMTTRLEQQDRVLQDLQTSLGQSQQKLTNSLSDLNNLTSLQGKPICPTCKRPLEVHELTDLIKEYTQQKDLIIKEKEYNEQKVAKGREIQENIRKQILEQNQNYNKLTNSKSKLVDYFQDQNEINDRKIIIESDEKTLNDLKQAHIEENLSNLNIEQQKLENQFNELQKKLKGLNDIQNDSNKLSQIEFEITEQEKQYDEEKKNNLAKQKQEFYKQRDESQHKVESLTILYDKITNYQALDTNLQNEKKGLLTCQQELAIKLVDLKKHDYLSYRKDNDEITELIGKYTAEIDQITKDQLPDLNKQLDIYKDRVKKITGLQQELQKTLKILDTAKVLSGMLTELPEYAIQEVCNAISDNATYKLKEIITQGTIDRITLESSFDIWILRDGMKQDLKQLSGGERVAVGIALRLAMSDLFTKLDFIILDEPTEFLDIQRKSDLVQLLEQSRPLGQLLLVTHEPAFVQCANHVIALKKIHGKTEKVNPEMLFQQVD